MKSKNLILTTLLAATTLAATQTQTQAQTQNSDRHSNVQVSLFPPLSTNGRHSADYTNDASFNIIAGTSLDERNVTLGGVANIVGRDAKGFQGAGVINVIGRDTDGFQAAGVANVIGREAEGFQSAGVANVTGGDIDGLQTAGVVNATGGDAEGMQAAGVANKAREMEGLQLAGVANLARELDGFQIAGVGNVARDVEGAQIAGVFNLARRVDGVQIAGVFNVADHSDYPIGLVNVIRDGEMSIGLGYNEIGTASVNFRSGGRVMYGIVGVGYNHRVKESRNAFGLTGGIGAHIAIAPWFRVNTELSSEYLNPFKRGSGGTFKSGLAVLPAFRVGRIELFGGPSINYMKSSNLDMYSIFPSKSLWDRQLSGRTTLQQIYFGWQAGVQFLIKN